MVSRLVFMLFVSVLLSFPGVCLSVRPLFDSTGTFCTRSGSESAIEGDSQPNLKSVGGKDDSSGTVAALSTSSRAPQASRIHINSSRTRPRGRPGSRQLHAAEPGPRDPPGSSSGSPDTDNFNLRRLQDT